MRAALGGETGGLDKRSDLICLAPVSESDVYIRDYTSGAMDTSKHLSQVSDCSNSTQPSHTERTNISFLKSMPWVHGQVKQN